MPETRESMPELAGEPVNPYTAAALHAVWMRLRRNKRNGQPRVLPVGVDGCSTVSFEKNLNSSIDEISRKVLHNGPEGPTCRFGPLLEINKIKPDGGLRRIYIARIRDQILLRAAHEDLLRAAIEAGMPLRIPSPGQLLNRVREAFRTNKPAWLLRTDLKSFFDSVPRDKVLKRMEALPVNSLTRKVLQIWDRDLRGRKPWTSGSDNDVPLQGLPQGLSISAPLAELWAMQMDAPMAERFCYFRYADDIALLCQSESEAHEALVALQNLAHSLDLQLSPGKTKIEKTEDGVNWLGIIHYPDHTEADPERVDRWFRRFVAIRRVAIQKLKQTELSIDKAAILKDFEKAILDEMKGRTSSRPAWYAGVKDTGLWKKLDSRLHAVIRSVYRKAGISLPMDKKLPSLHQHMLGRKVQIATPPHSKAD